MNERKTFGPASDIDGPTGGLVAFTDVTTNPETGTTAATYDHTTEHLSVVLPALVARCEQCDPCSLPPLYEAIDAEALDGLFADGERSASNIGVSFRYAGYEVSVESESLSVTLVQ